MSTSTLERVSRAEIVGALSLATDVGMSLPLESGLRIRRLALALAEQAGIDASRSATGSTTSRSCATSAAPPRCTASRRSSATS